MKFKIRNADAGSLDAVMRVEAHWPKDQRATVDKFASRMDIFPQGFFLAEVDGEVVGVSTSTLTNYDPANLSPYYSW